MKTVIIFLVGYAIISIILIIVLSKKVQDIEDNITNVCNEYLLKNYVGIRLILKQEYNINIDELSDKYWAASLESFIREENENGEENN